jgi:aspartokinase
MAMVTHSRMLDIIRRIGEATPPPIKLSRLIQSPEQDFFSFALISEKWMTSARVFELLAKSSVNIRFICQHLGKGGDLRVQLCADTKFQDKILKVFQTDEIARVVQEFSHQAGVVVLSLYPFNGQPQVSVRVFGTLRHHNIEILGANTATSVISCVVLGRDLELAVSTLKQIFVLQ